MYCGVRKSGQKKNKKNCCVHRFVWERFKGGNTKEHINNNKQDNRSYNLQLMTQKQNCQKSAKNRD